MTAAWAGIAMTAQRSGAAAQNGPKRFELLKAKAGSIPIQKAIALHAKNVGHLEGGPNHFSFFRLKLRLNVLGAGYIETVQRIGNCLQVPLRQMTVLVGGF